MALPSGMAKITMTTPAVVAPNIAVMPADEAARKRDAARSEALAQREAAATAQGQSAAGSAGPTAAQNDYALGKALDEMGTAFDHRRLTPATAEEQTAAVKAVLALHSPDAGIDVSEAGFGAASQAAMAALLNARATELGRTGEDIAQHIQVDAAGHVDLSADALAYLRLSAQRGMVERTQKATQAELDKEAVRSAEFLDIKTGAVDFGALDMNNTQRAMLGMALNPAPTTAPLFAAASMASPEAEMAESQPEPLLKARVLEFEDHDMHGEGQKLEVAAEPAVEAPSNDFFALLENNDMFQGAKAGFANNAMDMSAVSDMGAGVTADIGQLSAGSISMTSAAIEAKAAAAEQARFAMG